MSIINFNSNYKKVNLSIEEIAERNAKQDNKYFVGQFFSLNHSEIEKDGGKDFTNYNDSYECIEINISWSESQPYFFKLKLDNETSINFFENHLIKVIQ